MRPIDQFRTNTPRSRAAFDRARQIIPGGVQGNIKFFEPYPLSFQRASGAWLTDVDGHNYVDYLLSFGALILGHGHPAVRQAIDEAWNTYGTSSFGAPYPLEVAMAEKIRDLLPSVDAVRFTNSGLEATLLAIRLGMAVSGRTHLAKFDGHYHGGHEYVLMNTAVTPPGLDGRPEMVADSMGLPDYFREHTVVLPFDNLPLCEKILRERQDQVGVVIIEPLQAGYIPASEHFIWGLRELTENLGMVLVFDEVKTGFRVAIGGAQEYYRVRPDITALGKILGGGFPIGAVGGRREILELASPTRSRKSSEVVFHSGTFNGNPMSLSAGLRTLEFLCEPGRFQRIVETARGLQQGIIAIGHAYGFAVKTMGIGTIFNIMVNREAAGGDDGLLHPSRELREMLDFSLMKHGVFSKPLNRFSLSAVHGEVEITHTLDAFDKSFFELRNL